MLSNTEPGLLDQYQKGRSSVVERESPKLRVASSILASPELSWKCWIKSVFFSLIKTFYLLDFYNKKNMVKEMFYLLFF